MRQTIFVIPKPCGCRTTLEVVQRSEDHFEVNMWSDGVCGEYHQPHSEIRADFPWDLADGGYLLYTEEDPAPRYAIPKWAWSTPVRRVLCWDQFEAVEFTAGMTRFMTRFWRALPGETPKEFAERLVRETGAKIIRARIFRERGYITVADAV